MRVTLGTLLVATIASLGAHAQSVPKEVWGKWKITREIPTRTISCWGDREAKKILGTQIEYSARLFSWNGFTVKNPVVKQRTITPDQFRDENSSPSSSGSQVNFRQLGMPTGPATELSIKHDPANITKATTEIPGDSVLVKDSRTILFSVCNLYFEAKRIPVTKIDQHVDNN